MRCSKGVPGQCATWRVAGGGHGRPLASVGAYLAWSPGGATVLAAQVWGAERTGQQCVWGSAPGRARARPPTDLLLGMLRGPAV